MAEIESIEIGRLREHPDNPNSMSDANFNKLKRHIDKSGMYEPIVVRKLGGSKGEYQIINGHHRCKAMAELGYEKADCVVWDVDDKQVDILLMTLNRLGGNDIVEKKMEILKRLSHRSSVKELAKLLPGNSKQIEALQKFKLPKEITSAGRSENLASPVVFFLNEKERLIVEKALAASDCKGGNKAASRASGLLKISQNFLETVGGEKHGKE